MNKLRLVFMVAITDFTQLIKKHLFTFILFFGGLTIAFTTLFVFYMQSYAMLQQTNNIYSLNNSVEIYPTLNGNASKILQTIMDVNSEIPPVKSITVVSYQYHKYDVVGVKGDFINMIPQEGRLFDSFDDEGIIVSLQALKNSDSLQSINLGMPFNIAGKEYPVVAVLEARGMEPSFYDIRRIPNEKFVVTSVENDMNTAPAGADASVYLPIKAFINNSRLIPSVIRILFDRPLTEEDRNHVEKLLFIRLDFIDEDMLDSDMADNEKEQLINDIFISERAHFFAQFKTAEEVLSSDFISKLSVYVAIILLSMINILSIFSYILKKKARADIIYQMCGASKTLIVVANIMLMLLYLILTAAIGYIAGNTVIFQSDVFVDKRMVNIFEFFILFGIVLVFSVCALLKPIRQSVESTYAEAERMWHH